MRVDVVLDLETLGKGYCPLIVQIGAVAIDIDTGVCHSRYDKSCNISYADNIEGDTLLWWMKTNKELLGSILEKGKKSDLTPKALVEDFVLWLGDLMKKCPAGTKLYLWGNGSLFDNRILKENCDRFGIGWPIPYDGDRDLRTIYELAAKKRGFANAKEFRNSIPRPITIEHDGLADAMHEAIVLEEAWKVLTRKYSRIRF